MIFIIKSTRLVIKTRGEGLYAPDIEVTATDEELAAGRDAIIERALDELMK